MHPFPNNLDTQPARINECAVKANFLSETLQLHPETWLTKVQDETALPKGRGILQPWPWKPRHTCQIVGRSYSQYLTLEMCSRFGRITKLRAKNKQLETPEDKSETDLLHKTCKLNQRKIVLLQLFSPGNILFSPENILFSVTQHFLFKSSLTITCQKTYMSSFQLWTDTPQVNPHHPSAPHTEGGTEGSLAGKLTRLFGQRQESLGRNRFREVAKSCKMCL